MDSDSDYDSVPDTFNGSKSKIGPFLSECDRTFRHQPETFASDRAKVILATSHMRGPALDWVLKSPELSGISWADFSAKLCERFGQPDPAATAFHQLKRLRQHGLGTAPAYRTHFVHFADQVKWDSKDAAKKNKWFYRGLNDRVKDGLIQVEWDWKMPFDQFADLVIKLDEKIQKRELERGDKRRAGIDD